MKQWFPLTDYDFWAYLTAGTLVIAAADYSFGGEVLAQRAAWTTVQIAFWTVVAYLLGQVLAAPSAALLEHLLLRRVFHPPSAVCLGLEVRRRRERAVAAMFANREYAPLPIQVRARLVAGAATALDVAVADLSDPEAIFTVAFGVARKHADAAARMDQFRNLYGFARNAAFASLLAAAMLAVRLSRAPDDRTAYLLIGAAVLATGMAGRFLKFYAAYSREVFTAYNAVLQEVRRTKATSDPSDE